MIANILIEKDGNSSAINVWMVVYVVIICKTPIYTWNMLVKMMNMIIRKTTICILSMLVDRIILLLTKQIYQLSNLMKIIVKWHNQQKPMIWLRKLIGGMNYQWNLMKNQSKHADVQSVVSNATKHQDLKKSDIDYHLLGTSLFNNMPCKKVKWWKCILKNNQKSPTRLSSNFISF